MSLSGIKRSRDHGDAILLLALTRRHGHEVRVVARGLWVISTSSWTGYGEDSELSSIDDSKTDHVKTHPCSYLFKRLRGALKSLTYVALYMSSVTCERAK